MSDFAAGLCYGAALGLLLTVVAIYLADLVWPAIPTTHKDL